MALMTMGHVILACLVAMVTAAPTADRTNSQEGAVSLRGDGAPLDRGKRAKEEIVYGNQQNGVKVPAFAAKKSVGRFHFPPLMPSGLMPPGGSSPPAAGADNLAPPFPQYVSDKADQGSFPYFPSQAGPASYQYIQPHQPQKSALDKSGFMFASPQRPVDMMDPVLEETASELQAAPPPPPPPSPPGGEDSKKEVEEEKQKESFGEQKIPAQSAGSEQGAEQEPTPETGMGEAEELSPQIYPEAEEFEEGREGFWDWESSDAQLKPQAAALSSSPEVVESEVPVSQASSGPPQDSRLADAEEALRGQDQAMGKDDMEEFLKDLQEPKEISSQAGKEDSRGGEEEEEKEEQEEAKEEEEEEEEEEEGSAEKELLQMMSSTDGNVAPEKSVVESVDFAKQLLKYLLLNGNQYGRRYPPGYPSSYPSYYTQRRRRRSLVRRGRLPQIDRRRRSGKGKQLARSKRTKRDLLDDELYYNPNTEYAFQQAVAKEEEAEEEEEEERRAEMKELLSYLIALYPALYENQPPPRGSPYPGNMWYGNTYPEERYPGWEGAPEYMETLADWQQPPHGQAAPAWEPAFYPEEEEAEEDYYRAPGKRQRRGGYGGSAPHKRALSTPYGQGPYWGGLAPGSAEERVYEDVYQRLQDLAEVLAEARYQPPVYSLDPFSDYRNK
ncbi:hypothetical protein ACOMHN_037138 [Nucella lapillus]